MMRLVFLLVLVLFVGSGCGSSGEKRKPTLQARCTVRLEGGGVPTGAVVMFHPQDEEGYSPYRPRGRVEEDGNAPLMTYTTKDGLPAGEYVVTVVWPEQRPGGVRREGVEEIDQLGNRYSDFRTSPLKRTVKPGDRTIEAIVVTRPEPPEPDPEATQP